MTTPESLVIDTDLSMFTDTPAGGDPDNASPTLRSYHQVLWSKRLPAGDFFGLRVDEPGAYLFHDSSRGQFRLTSDAIAITFRGTQRMQELRAAAGDELLDTIDARRGTISNYLVFPGDRRDNAMTINGSRGTHPAIRDRFDLTLESIRRHYAGESSPLEGVLARYDDFFALFESFSGYTEFFLLQDLVSADGQVRAHLPIEDFSRSAYPIDETEMRTYLGSVQEFLTARDARIAAWAASNGFGPR